MLSLKTNVMRYKSDDGTMKNINALFEKTTTDASLSVLGAPADAKVTGDMIKDISDRLNESPSIVTPQMYGAKGDGTTDDTQAFKNALAENNNVYVPSGNYVISDTLDISYKKSLVSDDGQRATILYKGNNSVASIGRLSKFRNINITFPGAFSGIVFDTNNNNKNSGECALGSTVEHTIIDFKVASPNATLIGITIDSGTDANNKPRLTGVCFQTYHDIYVDNPSSAYGTGIRMELIQGRPFTEATKTGFPWITHIDFDDIFLGRPYTAIKTLVTNTSGSTHFERVNMGYILFNNVYTQWQDASSTRYFLDLEHISCYMHKCMPWDYHHHAWNGEKINIIGKDVTACITGCAMAAGDEFLHTCDFTAETEYNAVDKPEYFMNKYFKGSILSEGYDSIDAKIDAKLTGEYVASVSEEKINEILYSGYSNIMDDPLTQIKFRQRWSGSGQKWTNEFDMLEMTTVVIPIVQGGNVIRWSEPKVGNPYNDYPSLYFFNDDTLTVAVVKVGDYADLWNEEGNYLRVDNPNGYKYVSIPFCSSYFSDSELENMTMTINREITGNGGQSYTEYLTENVVAPAVEDAINNSGFLTSVPSEYITESELSAKKYLTAHQDISGKVDKTDTLTFVGIDADGNSHTWTIYGKVV